MEPADHGDTASWDNSIDTKEFRAQEKALLDEGRLEEAIQEMVDYAKTLDSDVFKSR